MFVKASLIGIVYCPLTSKSNGDTETDRGIN